MFLFKNVKQLAMQTSTYHVAKGIRLNSTYSFFCQGFDMRSFVRNKSTQKQPTCDLVKPRYLHLFVKSHGSSGHNPYVEETYTKVVDRLIENSKKRKNPAKKSKERAKGSTQPQEVKEVKLTILKEGGQLKGKLSK